MKKYGIFVAYGPAADMRAEGLGRYMGNFVKAFLERGDAQLVIAAPSWSRSELVRLFEEMNVPIDGYEIFGPEQRPVLARVLGLALRPRRPKTRRSWKLWLSKFINPLKKTARTLGDHLARTRSSLIFALICFVIAFATAGGLVAVVVLSVTIVPLVLARWFLSRLRASSWKVRAISALRRARLSGAKHSVVSYLHAAMQRGETALMINQINARTDVEAWYIPTAFWPAATKINWPRLICVPDVVVSDFPVAFSRLSSSFNRSYGEIVDTLENGCHFVTYSNDIKENTLVARHGIAASAISVIPHAPSSLAGKTTVEGFYDNRAATLSFNQTLLLEALLKSSAKLNSLPYLWTKYPNRPSFRFIFYASQFRPSKNVISLLKAYEFLLRKRYISHKLVLTGRGDAPEIRKFIEDQNLERDVLFVHRISENELSACYTLADLAVNPSLAEGGMPFTFAEALSVGTPVVMSDIGVTREIIVDTALREVMLFNPYDWRMMADKIEWALRNKDELYAIQRKFYDDVLIKRTWKDVVAEHISLMDEIAARTRPPL